MHEYTVTIIDTHASTVNGYYSLTRVHPLDAVLDAVRFSGLEPGLVSVLVTWDVESSGSLRAYTYTADELIFHMAGARA